MICPPLKKSRAFSLAELLVSSLITSALLFGLAGTIYLLIEIRRYTDDLDAALSRAEMVFSILRTPIEYSGYGLPKDETDYMECFGMPAVSPYNWPGPLSVSFSNRVGMGRRENAVCKITYAIETKCRTLTQEAVSGDRFKIAASGTPAQLLTDAKDADPETIIQNWFVFGAMTPRRVPARYTGRSTAAKITYLSFKFKKAVSEPVLIPENDEIYGLRALECEVRKRDDEILPCTPTTRPEASEAAGSREWTVSLT
ncbi:MAG: hypothetical protein LBE65_06555 [Synergistaceae bacterium]|jgi:hypothetical protein|nr:hypothetical protein [Synergistaceae bacterium]